VNKLGWALILVGGGLVVYGVRKLIQPAESEESDYDPDFDPENPYDQADWGSDKVTKTDPFDLNDGA
jgi:hypothetical protein